MPIKLYSCAVDEAVGFISQYHFPLSIPSDPKAGPYWELPVSKFLLPLLRVPPENAVLKIIFQLTVGVSPDWTTVLLFVKSLVFPDSSSPTLPESALSKKNPALPKVRPDISLGIHLFELVSVCPKLLGVN